MQCTTTCLRLPFVTIIYMQSYGGYVALHIARTHACARALALMKCLFIQVQETEKIKPPPAETGGMSTVMQILARREDIAAGSDDDDDVC